MRIDAEGAGRSDESDPTGRTGGSIQVPALWPQCVPLSCFPMPPSLLISDLSVAEPADALADLPLSGKWYRMSYETAEGRGNLLRSFPESPAPRVRIPFTARGSFAVYVGIHYAQGERDDLAIRFGAHCEFARLRARLAGDDAFHLILPEVQNAKSEPDPDRSIRQDAIAETFWRYACFDGPSWLEIEPGVDGSEPCPGNPACLAWLRLAPLDGAERALARSLEPAPQTRCITAVTSLHDPCGYEQVASLGERLAEADIDRVYLDLCRFETCRFPTRTGHLAGDVPFDCGNFEMRAARALKARIDDGWDPLADACAQAGRRGARAYLAMRIALQRDPPQHLGVAWPTRVATRRDWWVQDRHGDPYPHPALAVPAVRQRIVALFSDAAERYDLAGVCVLGVRGWPWVGCEPESARLFKQRHDAAITDVDEADPRFVEHRCHVLGLLFQELRAALNDVGRRRGRPVRVAVDAMNCVDNCRGQGLDVVTWANTGLIDELTLNACHWTGRPVAEPHPTPDFTRAVRAAIDDPGFTLRAHIWPRFLAPHRYLERAAALLDAGADGVAMWDLGHRTARLSEWAVQRHLGHRDCYDELSSTCRRYWRHVPIERMDGVAFSNPDYSGNSAG